MPSGNIRPKEIDDASSIKAHRTTSITTPTLDTWTSIGEFTIVSTESPGNAIVLQNDDTTFELRKPGLYRFNGCLKMQNNTTGQVTARVLVRLLANGNDELRCSQRQ